ncbi:MAG: DUF1206 domain-containing protein, partial [Bryobacteraceae bacterium]
QKGVRRNQTLRTLPAPKRQQAEEAMGNLSDVQRHAARTYSSVARSPWTERLARLGFAAKGVVYIIIGVLAAMAGLGIGGETTNTKGAVQQIGQQPFGQVLLAFVAAGLLGYSFWRIFEGVTDAENKGSDVKGLALRTGFVASGVVHAGLALFAIRLLMGSPASSGDQTADWTATLMSQPFGVFLVAIAGAVAIGVGFGQFFTAHKEKFRENLRLGQMNSSGKEWAIRAGKFGHYSRGVVFCIIGIFLIIAARRADPSEAKGLDGALVTLSRQPYGPYLLVAVALGLVAYGAYMLVEARYRRVRL